MRIVLALLVLVSFGAVAQESWEVVHKRALWPDQTGTLSVRSDGLLFEQARQKDPEKAKAIRLSWNEIQELKLEERALELVSYHDVRWQFGRDRPFRFEIPNGAGAGFASLERTFRRELGSRLVVALPTDTTQAQWEIPAKRMGLFRGAEGILAFSGDELVFSTERPGASRRWPIDAIESIAQTGPLAFTVTAPERALSDMGSRRSFEFQLKQPLSPQRYRALWREIEKSHGTHLRFADSQ